MNGISEGVGRAVEILQKNVHEVLDKYLAGELLYRIEREIVHAVAYDLMKAEEEGGGSDG